MAYNIVLEFFSVFLISINVLQVRYVTFAPGIFVEGILWLSAAGLEPDVSQVHEECAINCLHNMSA